MHSGGEITNKIIKKTVNMLVPIFKDQSHRYISHLYYTKYYNNISYIIHMFIKFRTKYTYIKMVNNNGDI